MVLKPTASKARQNKGKNKMIHRRRKKPSIRPNMQLGDLYILQRVATPSGSSGGQKWRCECSCGTRLTIPQWYLVRKEWPKRNCGCIAKNREPSYVRERGIFYMMHRRCYNSTHVAYKHYGGATPPIGVCDAWNKDVVAKEVAWANFIKDMGPAPSRGHTLDRIDPYKGYGWQKKDGSDELYLNCRWATATEQMNNLKRHWLHPDERALIAQQAIESFDAEVSDGQDADADAEDTDTEEEEVDGD